MGVALKFLPPYLNTDPDANKRFVREAKAASALDHPNLCTIYDIGHDANGQLFIAMAYYPGQTLKYRITDGLTIDAGRRRVSRIRPESVVSVTWCFCWPGWICWRL